MSFELLEHPDIETLENYCETMSIAYDEIGPDGTKGKWAQMNDAYLVAMYLRRPIIIIRPNVSQKEISARKDPPKWTASYIQQRSMPLLLEIYDDDGFHMVELSYFNTKKIFKYTEHVA